MDVDTAQFLEDVATLKRNRVIVKDKEIVDSTGVSKGNLSTYLSGATAPSKSFLKKFYEVYREQLKTKVLVSHNPDTYSAMIDTMQELIDTQKVAIDSLVKLNKSYEKEIAELKAKK